MRFQPPQVMNYWVFKANPANYSYKKFLRPGVREEWYSRFAPVEVTADDRVFLWESGSRRRIVGLAEVVRGRREWPNADPSIKLRYLTHPLSYMPSPERLRQIAGLRRASFLGNKSYRTAYALSHEEAALLYAEVIAGNPRDAIWRDVSAVEPLHDVDRGVTEGKRRFVQHLRVERAPGRSHEKRDQFVREHGKLFCEACGDDYARFGDLAEAAFEVHHRKSLAARGQTKTKLKDLAVVCSSCHRAIHRTDPMLSVEKFAAKIRR